LARAVVDIQLVGAGGTRMLIEAVQTCRIDLLCGDAYRATFSRPARARCSRPSWPLPDGPCAALITLGKEPAAARSSEKKQRWRDALRIIDVCPLATHRRLAGCPVYPVAGSARSARSWCDSIGPLCSRMRKTGLTTPRASRLSPRSCAPRWNTPPTELLAPAAADAISTGFGTDTRWWRNFGPRSMVTYRARMCLLHTRIGRGVATSVRSPKPFGKGTQ
jgi:hypothetical protein